MAYEIDMSKNKHPDCPICRALPEDGLASLPDDGWGFPPSDEEISLDFFDGPEMDSDEAFRAFRVYCARVDTESETSNEPRDKRRKG
jgi:hypothetical protein